MKMVDSLEKWAYWSEEKADRSEVRMVFIKLLEKVTRNASGAPLQEHTLEGSSCYRWKGAGAGEHGVCLVLRKVQLCNTQSVQATRVKWLNVYNTSHCLEWGKSLFSYALKQNFHSHGLSVLLLLILNVTNDKEVV